MDPDKTEFEKEMSKYKLMISDCHKIGCCFCFFFFSLFSVSSADQLLCLLCTGMSVLRGSAEFLSWQFEFFIQ